MFGSRKKGRKQYTMAQPPTAATVNPNAATAAVSAYKLSSAAAAAALRALPATPTDVSAVQTKRTQRRSASLSSEGSRRALSPGPSIKRVMGLSGGNASSEQRNGRVASPLGVPTLRRRGSASSMRSVSSMSERTFRSPSPHQSRGYTNPSITSSPGGSVTGSRKPPINAAGAAAAAAAGRSAAAAGTSGLGSRSRSVPPPPVPTIPQHVIDNHPSNPPEQSNTKLKKSRRITSLGFVQQPLRLASQKQQSQGNSRSSWFRPGAVGDVSDIRTSDQPMDINGYAHASDDQRPTSPTERPGSRSSLHNFSYPSRQRLSSPPASPTHSRNTSLTESVGTAGAASATALPLRKTNSILRSVSTERAPKQQTSKSSGAVASRRSASTSRVPGHPHGSSSSDQELVYDANSRRMVPRGQLLMLEESIFEAPVRPQQPQQVHQQQQPRPQRKKKQQHVQQQQSQAQSQAKTPTHQKQASPVAAVVPPSSKQDAPSVAPVTKSRTAPVEPKKQAPESRTEEPITDNVDEAVQPVPALSTSASTPSSSVSSLPVLASTQTTPPAIQSQKSPVDSTADSESFAPEDNRPVLIKRPSIVHEDPEREEEEGRHLHSPVPVDSEQSRSRSPLRTAHFSPIVANNLTVLRHSPPPRSISPRKSAMKQTSSPRDTSPSDSASDAAAVPYQPPTNAEILKRKKANRVSFDEKATVLSGPPTSPIQPASPASSLPGAAEAPASSHTAHQPPTRSRSWFSNMGRSKKKTSNDASMDDDDVVMKPRPALPSFGSVRDKPFSTSQQEERPLVKPNDNQPPSRLSTTSSPPPPSVLKSTPLETLDTSSDHAIGSIISSSEGQAASAVTRNTANTSRYREPLPPVVTSVDGNGYVSDSGANTSSDDDDDEASAAARVVPDSDDEEHSPVLRFDEEQDTTVPAPIASAFAATADSAIKDSAQQAPTADVPRPTSPSSKNTVPAISVSHPSQENLVAVRGTDSDDEDVTAAAYSDAPAVALPSHGHPSSPVRSLFDVPGTFPDTDSDSTRKSSPTQADFNNTAVPVRQDAFEPITQDDDLTYSPQMPATVFATHMPTLHEEAPLSSEKVDEEDSDSEVFSDAYEDLSDIEGDGFLSLDAVVDSPIVPTFSKSPFGSSILTGSPPRKQESVQLEPSSLPGSISSPSSAPNIVAASSAVVGGTSISMSALMASAASKSAGMGTMNPDDKDDWDKVKAFWRGLSAEKRAQLESVAREDAAADGDLEEESSAAIKKPRRKKSVETRLAEKKAIQESSLSTTSKATETNEEAVTSPVEHKTEAVAATRIRRSMRDKATAGSVEEKETGGPGLMPSTLRRRGSDSSESSFKRARGPGAGLRKSLRTEPKPTTADTDAITLANTAANENLDRRGSRFSLRSLSPTGSTTLRGSTESSPQFRRTLRDGPGFAASEAKRMSSPGPMANATLRKGAGSESSGGFFSSLGRKSGGKLLQRSKNPGGDGKSFSRTRFGDSSDDDDDDVFRPSSGHGNSSARRTTSAGAYTFRSRFVDSSDEDEVVSEQRIARPQGKNYVVPKTMRGAPSNGISNTSLRPGSSSAAKGPQVPERLTEAEEDEAQKSANRTKSPQPARNTFSGLSKSGAASANAPGNGNIGTTTLRRTRSGRGQMMVPMSPGYSPTTTGVTGVGLGARAPSPTRHRRASSIMSVLRRKKPDTTSSAGYVGGIGRGELVDSAARRDTQLERNTQELAAMRSSSAGSSQRQRSLNRTLRGGNGSSGSTPRIMPLDGEDSDDLDEDDSEDGPRRAANGGARSARSASNVNNSWPLRGPGPMANNLDFLNDSASNLGSGSLQQKKKKFPALRRMFRLND
ncbi:hypothetical protein F503_00801 [Ophiostoma piceae UAMH 11346]|uniref:Uncharacterized protein n=1 Tax=Ophiostoma piceae (strain UAMH 11346) TaxID=1262450 RepID=S3CNA2_OPHP1|nr:hypothetical protein F503_00801 [Ophiostoma piceae UAMH 11346]